MTKIYDITRTVENDMPVWPGDIPVELTFTRLPNYRYTRIMMGGHTGTHVDAPIHFLPEGAGADALDLHILLGKVRVIEIPSTHQIGRPELSCSSLEGVSRLLLSLNTSSSKIPGDFIDYSALTVDAANYLISQGIKLIGIDSPSVDIYSDETYPAHRVLLEAGIVILEGIDLSGVPAGDYELLCLPLKLKNADGAPARVVLRDIA